MFENFPYTNFHELNLDWIIKISKDFLDQYTHIQEIITTGESSLTEIISNGEESLSTTINTGIESLEEKATQLEGLLNQWYQTHSEDIAQELATAIADIRSTLASSINQFHNDSSLYVQQLIDTIPEDYSALAAAVEAIDIKSFVNLYNPYADGIATGGYYNYIGGWSTNAAWMSTDYIPVTPGKHYYVSEFEDGVNPHLQVVFYNASKEFVSGINSEPNTYIEIPENIAYMKIPMLLENRYRFSIVEGDNIPPDFLPFYDKAINVTNIKPNVRIVKNLYNPDASDNEYGGYYNYLNVWGAHAEWMESGYIRVEPGEKYVGSSWPRDKFQLSILLFDGSKSFVTGLQWVNNGILTIPESICYVRIPIYTSERYSFSFTKGTVPSPASCPYNKECLIIDDIVLDNEHLDSKIDELETAISTQTNYIGVQWNGKTWYCYGTSLSNSAGEGRYPTYLAQMSNMIHINKGISGGGIGDLGAYSHGQVYDAICNITDGKLDADIITLETGANDVDTNVPLGTIYDTGTTTLAGCLNDCIRYLQANTDAQVVIIPSPPGTVTGQAFEKYMDWVKMIKEICYINSCHFIENNDNVGYGKAQSSKKSLYLTDNIHPTPLGGYVMAENIWYQLRNIPVFRTSIPG